MIGERIRFLRKKLNLTQGELAAKCGWSISRVDKSGRIFNLGQLRISSYENGHRQPPIAAAVIIAQALRVSVKKLITEDCVKNNTKSIDKNK